MPYTPKERRPSGNQEYKSICLEKKGDLTAVIFDLMLRYIDEHELCYQNISDAVAAANDAAYEVQRRVQTPYEQNACAKNGDFNRMESIYNKTWSKFNE